MLGLSNMSRITLTLTVPLLLLACGRELPPDIPRASDRTVVGTIRVASPWAGAWASQGIYLVHLTNGFEFATHQAELLQGNNVRRRALQRFAQEPEKHHTTRVEARANPNAGVVYLTVTATDAIAANDFWRATYEAYQDVIAEQWRDEVQNQVVTMTQISLRQREELKVARARLAETADATQRADQQRRVDALIQAEGETMKALKQADSLVGTMPQITSILEEPH